MKNAMTKLLCVILMSAFFLNLPGGEVLLDGTAEVKLEITAPIEAEKTAETELKTYIKRIFAAYPGKSESHARFILCHDPELGDQEFKIRCADNQVVITGGRPQGLLYGTYWFLDRKMGVHLYDAYAEYCPSKEKIAVKEFEKSGRPAFSDRMYLFTPDEAGLRWATFNLLSGNRPVREADLIKKYGERPCWAPPLGSHGMLGLIPADMFKNRPEFFALQDGKRIDPVKRGVTVDYCLTNEELIKTTVKRCLHFLKMTPTARYISIAEGDGNRGMCACEKCQTLVKAHGDRESARWVYFANRVAEQVKKEYPKVKLVIFAYIASQKPPENMKVDDNLATNWTPGLGVGWTMIDLGENRFINRITTVFHRVQYVRRATYQVEGSFDRKAWRTMIPKKTVTVPEKIQQAGNPLKFFCFDDVVLDKDVEARYIRTRIFKIENRRADGVYRGNDAQHT